MTDEPESKKVDLEGDAVPPSWVDLAFPFYTGRAGHVARDGWQDASYLGEVPTDKLPITGTLNGQPCKVVMAVKEREAKGFVFLRIVMTADAADG